MKVVRADILGFCSGVRRAVNSASDALDSSSGGTVYTFGPLIHNPIVLDAFARRGLRVLSAGGIGSVRAEDTVIIRAHGVPPEIVGKLSGTGCRIVNATCPLVMQSQRRAADYASRGFTVVFAGDANHGEVVGIEGCAVESYAKNGFAPDFLLVRDVSDVDSLAAQGKITPSKKTVLLSQTTFGITMFGKISARLSEIVPDAEIVSSICPATHERQSALERLCSVADGILVVGGRSSANTNRLLAVAAERCAHAALIESKAEIPAEFFSLGCVGLTAGASTPDDVIDEVEECLVSRSVLQA